MHRDDAMVQVSRYGRSSIGRSMPTGEPGPRLQGSRHGQRRSGRRKAFADIRLNLE